MQPPQMPARRTAEEVVAAARAMDQARAAGLPDRLLLVMLAARSAWWGDADWPPHAELVEVPPGSVCAEIVDAGAGMDAETLARVGEPFFTTKPPGEGMGLGLFLTRALAEQLGGSLTLQSRPGEGTRARLCLPAVPDDSPSSRR